MLKILNTMLYLIAGTICLLFLGLNFYLLYKNSSLKLHIRFLSNTDTEQKSEISILQDERIKNIREIESLSSDLKNKIELLKEFEKLKNQSSDMTKAALFELGNNLSKQLIDLHKKENAESRSSSERNIQNITKRFNVEFERVVNMIGSINKEIEQSKDSVDTIKNSLLSPSGAGNLAEITLENILKSSGLRSELDFIMQYSLKLDDKILRPDAVIFLPNDNIMVIDAKASKFLLDNDVSNAVLMKTMNNHLRSLSSKDYAQNVKSSLKSKTKNWGHVVTLMFLPSEHAVEKVLDADPEFIFAAQKLNIFPVGPTGLMNMLSFAKFQISQNMMLDNYQKITEEVKKLIGSVGSMTEHANKLAGSLQSASNHYDKFASSFEHNFLSKVRNITNMGISTSSRKTVDSLRRFQLIESNAKIVDINSSNNDSEKITDIRKIKQN